MHSTQRLVLARRRTCRKYVLTPPITTVTPQGSTRATKGKRTDALRHDGSNPRDRGTTVQYSTVLLPKVGNISTHPRTGIRYRHFAAMQGGVQGLTKHELTNTARANEQQTLHKPRSPHRTYSHCSRASGQPHGPPNRRARLCCASHGHAR